jgi:hypothetical protein
VGTGQNSGTVFWIEPSLCWEHFQISALGLPPSVTSSDATCKIDGKPGALHLLATYEIVPASQSQGYYQLWN